MRTAIYRNILAAVAGVALVASCAREQEGFEAQDDEMIPLNISSAIDQIPTKANEAGFEDGDGLGLFAVNYSDNNATAGTLAASGNQADNVKYVFDKANSKWTPMRTVYYKNAETHADLYLYYPYLQSVSDIEEMSFEVKQDQTVAATSTALSAYEASDFLWGKATNVTPSESKVTVSMGHKMSGIKVTLTKGTGFDEDDFSALEKSVIVMNTTRKATINMATGVVTKLGDAQLNGIITCPQTDGTYRAIVVPQTVASGKQLLAITIDGTSYSFSRDAATSYEAGKLVNMEIAINKKTVGEGYTLELKGWTISAWSEDSSTSDGEARQYYVVNVETAGTLQSVIEAAGKNPAKIKNLKITGNINATDFTYMREKMTILQAINIKEVSVENNTIPENALSGKTTLYYCALPDNVVAIGNSAFYNTRITGALIIPDGVTSIGNKAFQSTRITSLSLPDGLLTVGDEAFQGCNYVTGTLSLPNTITYIGGSAFSVGGTGFSGKLVLPENLEEIGNSAFYNAGTFVGGLRIPDKVTKLGTGSPYAMFENISGPLDLNNVKYIGGWNFGSWMGTPKFTGELVLPEGIELGGAALAGMPITSLVFPSSMPTIASSAFSSTNICQDLELPSDVVEIESSAFADCHFMTGLHIPATTDVIGESAFKNCYALTKLICDNPEPPTLGTGVFDGVPKDNFAVEVPESSVAKYKAANGWGDFKRIVAHRDFSISRSYFNALNAQSSETYVLRAPADGAWSVEECPEWVSVSPSSGTGKQEVTVTVSELTKGDGQRSGDLVFLLADKDYRTTMTVTQYDYTYGDGDVYTFQEHTKGNGVNIVLLGDCYDASNIASGNYLSNLKDAYEWFFNIEPYSTYKDYFNVYAVFGKSNDSGIGTVNTIKDAKFGSQYTVDSGVAPNQSACFSYACKAPINNDVSKTLIILVENTTQYGGVTYMYGDGSAIAVCPMSGDAYPFDFRGIVQHEAGGHGFGKLGDEYIYVNAFISSCDCKNPHLDSFNAAKAMGWYRNMESTGDMHEVGWSHLIFNPQYSSSVDIFEGGYFHTRGIYRSESTSCMNNNIPYFSAISRQAIVERIMALAGETFSLDDFYTNDSSDFGPKTKGATATPYQKDWGVSPDFTNGLQHEPVYMGEHPDFKLSK